MDPVYVSTACMPGTEPLTDRVERYHGAGLEAVELGAGLSVEEGWLEWVNGKGKPFLVHNYFPPPAESFVLNLASSNDGIRSRSLDLVTKALDYTAQLEAPFYTVHAGFITDATSFGTTSFILPMPASPAEGEEAMERFVAALRTALDHAEALDVQLLVENNVCSRELKGKLLLQTADEFDRLFRAISSPNLGVLLDTGHLNVTAHTLGFDRLEFIRRVAPHVRALHIHENDGMADYHRPISPGSWVLDVLRWPKLAGLPLLLETKFEDVSDLARHVAWLKRELGRA